MKAVILGATKGMGRAVARALAERGDAVFLLGRDERELERSAADLSARAGKPDAVAGFAACDLEKPETFAPALDRAQAALGRIDTVVVTAGLFAPQDRLEADAALLRRVLTVDFTNTVLFCEEAAPPAGQPGRGRRLARHAVRVQLGGG